MTFLGFGICFRMETATATDHGNIQEAAVVYLELQRKAPHLTEGFLGNLRDNLGWSDVEITQLLTRVVDVLLDSRERQA